MEIFIQYTIFIMLLILFSILLGEYIYLVMSGNNKVINKIFGKMENKIYKLIGTNKDENMSAKKYTQSVLYFSLLSLVFILVLLMLQGAFIFDANKAKGMNFSLAFNTAASFVTNTNWQAYIGERDLTYFAQSVLLTVQNFVTPAVGLAVLFALIRGFVYSEENRIGNFWVDLLRGTIYIFIPLSFLLAVILMSQGVVQSLLPSINYTALESGKSETIPLGLAASQIAIKQLGTNGGGFFGANSAFPLENPTVLTNYLEMLSILIVPASCVIAFGKMLKEKNQGIIIYFVMIFIFVLGIIAITVSEFSFTSNVAGVIGEGNMKGKEIVHGVESSALWSAAATAASSGSVNASLDSLTPLGGLVPLFLMQLGEIVFGGVGSGLYTMIAYVILTVFIAGLMVGRTPEYLRKKIEPYDMKMVCLVIIVPPLLTLIGTSITIMLNKANLLITNTGAHGFSEILYAFTSMANNNGSSFGGFNANNSYVNIFGGIIMIASRFIPITAVIYLSENLSKKKKVAVSSGSLTTTNATFVSMLLVIILLIGALGFLPALSLGPIADFFTSVH